MTRAKDELSLIVTQRFYIHQQARTGDRHVFAGRSRFIPAALAHHFNRVSWPIARQTNGAAPVAKPQVDICERMRGMWSKTG